MKILAEKIQANVLNKRDANVKMDFQFVVEEECLEGKSDLFSLSMNKQLVNLAL